MFLCCVGSGLCDELITLTEESCRVGMCLIVRDLATSTMRRPAPELGCCSTERNDLESTSTSHFAYAVDALNNNDKIYRC